MITTFFQKMASKDDGIRIVRAASIVNLILAAIAFFFLFGVGIERLYDGLIQASVAFCLLKYKSRIAAILLMIFPIQKMFYVEHPLSYMILLLILLIDFRAVEATFKLSKKNGPCE